MVERTLHTVERTVHIVESILGGVYTRWSEYTFYLVSVSEELPTGELYPILLVIGNPAFYPTYNPSITGHKWACLVNRTGLIMLKLT